ncbi:MAG: hypothetical protein VB959_10145, partial [Rhodospirillales bacterium]
MKALIKTIVFGLVGLVGVAGALMIAAANRPALAQDPDFISLGAGYFDFNRQKDQGAEFRLEYRSSKKLWVVKPFAAAAYASP